MQAHWSAAAIASLLLSSPALAEPPVWNRVEPLAYPYFNRAPIRVLAQPFAEKSPKTKFEFDWDSGLYFRTANKNFEFNIGATLHADIARFSSDLDEKPPLLPPKFVFDDDTEFRRARLHLEGALYKDIEFKVQVEFADGIQKAEYKGVYVNFAHVDECNVQIGQFKEPFSLDQLTSSSNGAFMERALSTELAPGRSTGVMAHGGFGNGRFSYALGGFLADDGNDSNRQSGDHAYTARFTHQIPIHDQTYLHLGVAKSERDISGGFFDESFAPPANLSPNILKENDIFAADESDLTGFEIAAVHGPIWAIFELVQNELSATDGLADAEISGNYMSAGWFITGENRSYKKSSGAFGKVDPINPFNWSKGGWGAWELAVRVSEIEFENLRDKTGPKLFTDELSSMTIGLNWYLNSNVRAMLNYVEFDVTSEAGKNNSPTTVYEATGKGSGEVIQARLSISL